MHCMNDSMYEISNRGPIVFTKKWTNHFSYHTPKSREMREMTLKRNNRTMTHAFPFRGNR
jgi:hypothetical protein